MFDNLNDALLYLRRNQGALREPRYFEAAALAVERRPQLQYRVPIRIEPGNCDPSWGYIRDHSLAISPDGLERLIEPSATSRRMVKPSDTQVVVKRGKVVVLSTVGSWGKTAHVAMTITADGDAMIGVFDPLIGIPDLPHPAVTSRPLHSLWVPQPTAGGVVPIHMLHRTTTEKSVVVPLASVVSVDRAAGTVTVMLDRSIERVTPRLAELEAGKWGCLDIEEIVRTGRLPTSAHP